MSNALKRMEDALKPKPIEQEIVGEKGKEEKGEFDEPPEEEQSEEYKRQKSAAEKGITAEEYYENRYPSREEMIAYNENAIGSEALKKYSGGKGIEERIAKAEAREKAAASSSAGGSVAAEDDYSVLLIVGAVASVVSLIVVAAIVYKNYENH